MAIFVVLRPYGLVGARVDGDTTFHRMRRGECSIRQEARGFLREGEIFYHEGSKTRSLNTKFFCWSNGLVGGWVGGDTTFHRRGAETRRFFIYWSDGQMV